MNGLKGFFKDLPLTQLVAGALAAATSFLLSSQIGITGSLIGVVVGSVVSAVSTQLYKRAINSSTEALKQSLGMETDGDDTSAEGSPSTEATAGSPAGSQGPVGDGTRAARTYGPATAGLGGSASPYDAGGAVYGSRYSTAYTHAQDDTDVWGMRPIGAHSAHVPDATSAYDSYAGASARADEDDAARATEAIASLDNDPTLLVGEGGSALYPAGSAAGSTPTRAYGTNAGAGTSPQVDRTMRMPVGSAATGASAGTDAYAYGSFERTADGTYAAQAARDSAGSPYGSVAAHEAQARKIARRNKLIGVVTVLSALVAVAVVAVLVNVFTSGEGIGYRPTPIISSSPANLQEPTAPEEAPQATDAPVTADTTPDTTDQAGTTTTTGTGTSATPGAEAGANAGTTTTGTDANGGIANQGDQGTGDAGAAGTDAGAGETGGNTDTTGDAGATVTPGADAGANETDTAGTPDGGEDAGAP